MSEYQRLQAQIADLQQQAASILKAEKRAAIGSINDLIVAFDIAPNELKFASGIPRFGAHVRQTCGALGHAPVRSKSHPTAGKVLPARFRDANGNSWSGRGLQPKWLRKAVAGGETLESFRIVS